MPNEMSGELARPARQLEPVTFWLQLVDQRGGLVITQEASTRAIRRLGQIHVVRCPKVVVRLQRFKKPVASSSTKASSLLSSTDQGVARTSREGDRDDRTASTGRSITLRNGACPCMAATRSTNISNTLDAPTSQTRAAVAADRSHPQRTRGGRPEANTHTHWAICSWCCRPPVRWDHLCASEMGPARGVSASAS